MEHYAFTNTQIATRPNYSSYIETDRHSILQRNVAVSMLTVLSSC